MSNDWWNQGWESFKVNPGDMVSSAIEMGSDCDSFYWLTTGGYWSRNSPEMFTEYGLPVFAFQLTCIYLLNILLQFLLKHLRLPRVFSQIMVGVLLGPTLVNLLVKKPASSGTTDGMLQENPGYLDKLYGSVVAVSSSSALANLSMFGFVIFQFLIGVKMDPTMIYTTGKKAFVIGSLSVLVPLVISGQYASILRTHMGYPYSIHRILTFIGASQCMTSFPVVADLLGELNILNSEIGRLALSSAFVGDMVYRVFDVVTTSQRINISSLWISVMVTVSFVAIVIFVKYAFRPACIWIIRQTPEGKQVQDHYIVFILLIVISSSLASLAIGQHVLLGPFILGLAVPDGPPLGLSLVNKLETFFSDLMVPVFLLCSGLRTDFTKVTVDHGLIIGSVILVAIIIKFMLIFFISFYNKVTLSDSLALAFILCTKGVVEMAIYNAWKDAELLDDEAFSIVVLALAIMMVLVTYSVRVLYDPSRKYAGYVKRTIRDHKSTFEFRIIVCVHEQENVPTIIKLLQTTNPTSKEPIYVYLIHLVELLGRSAPLLISHKLWTTESLQDSQSQQIINAFRHYERKYEGALSVQPYTAISPVVTMHDDICLLAMSKRASFIIIPFHKQWTVDGSMGSTNLSIRTVNNNVLNRAPCSVGLLVDRGHLGRSAVMLLNNLSYRVGVIFLGGDDDREALALAQRMAENPGVVLKVYQFIPVDNTGMNTRQLMLDDEAIAEFKKYTIHSGDDERVMFFEEVVRDGEQMMTTIKRMENEHDLMMLGRRNGMFSPLTKGLSEWNECPELGILGDILASSDVKSALSVLVLQQQITGRSTFE